MEGGRDGEVERTDEKRQDATGERWGKATHDSNRAPPGHDARAGRWRNARDALVLPATRMWCCVVRGPWSCLRRCGVPGRSVGGVVGVQLVGAVVRRRPVDVSVRRALVGYFVVPFLRKALENRRPGSWCTQPQWAVQNADASVGSTIPISSCTVRFFGRNCRPEAARAALAELGKCPEPPEHDTNSEPCSNQRAGRFTGAFTPQQPRPSARRPSTRRQSASLPEAPGPPPPSTNAPGSPSASPRLARACPSSGRTTAATHHPATTRCRAASARSALGVRNPPVEPVSARPSTQDR